MIAWWIIPTVVTVLAIAFVVWLTVSPNPYAGMIAFAAALPAAGVTIVTWLVCFLLKVWLS
jgi:hypothetical protein